MTTRRLIWGVTLITVMAVAHLGDAQQADSIKIDTTTSRDTTGQVAATIEPLRPPEAAADTIYPITPERRELLNKYSNFSLGWSVFYDVLNWLLLLVVAFS